MTLAYLAFPVIIPPLVKVLELRCLYFFVLKKLLIFYALFKGSILFTVISFTIVDRKPKNALLKKLYFTLDAVTQVHVFPTHFFFLTAL